MTDRELMQQALAALEYAAERIGCPDDDDAIGVARKALRERLAQPVQEPVQDDLIPPDSLFVCGQMGANVTRVRLAEPVQEPVAHVYLFEPNGRPRVAWDNANGIKIGDKLYTAPPKRKPLTDEEILTYRHMIDWTAEWSYINFARAIEAAHGIKE